MNIFKVLLALFLFLNLTFCMAQEGQDPTQQLLTAIVNKQSDAALAAIANGAKVNVRTEKGLPLLNIAAYFGQTEVVAAMIAKSVNPALSDKDGQGALFLASRNGFLPIVRLLTDPNLGTAFVVDGGQSVKYERGADVNAQNKDGSSALHAAAAGGHIAIAEELIAREANVNIQNKAGHTPLMLASSGGDLALVQFLIAQGADPHLEALGGETALGIAEKAGHQDLVEFLASTTNPNPTVTREDEDRALAQELLDAINEGKSALAVEVIKAGADVNLLTTNGTPLLNLAVSRGMTDVVKEMIAASVDPNLRDAKGLNSLMVAALLGKLSEAKLLTDPSLGIVAKVTSEGVVRYNRGAHINDVSSKGNTALMSAIASSHLAVAEELLGKGAEVNHQNMIGFSALMIASQYGHKNFVAMLLENGADVKVETKEGYTVLDVAESNKRGDIVKLLAKNGAKHSERWLKNSER